MVNNKEKVFMSVVLYVYNNQNEIIGKLNNINNILRKNFEKYEIICVNDFSTDKSLENIKKFSDEAEHEAISVINMSFYQGLESSMKAGVDLAIGDFVIEFDNLNVEYDEKVVMDAYKKVLEGYDIVSVSPKKNSKIVTDIFYKVFNHYSNIEHNLRTEYFRILSRRAINRVFSVNQNILYRKVAYANSGLKICNIEYENLNVNNKKFNKQVSKSRENTAMNSLILFTNIGYKFSVFMITLMLCITIFVALYTVVVFINKIPVPGWTTTMLFLSISFFGVFTLMAIIIKYLEIITGFIARKNNYIVESINKLN